MSCQSEVEIGANLMFTVAAHNQGTGALVDADSLPAYRIYEDETGTPILTGNMAKLDDAGTFGFYSEQIAAIPANGFESGKSYAIYITIVVAGVTYAITYGFRAMTLADIVWDEILTGTTHNIATSAGRRIREIGAYAVHSGTAQAGNSHSITLAATADANDGVYNRNLIVLVENTGVGQTRTIVDYDATTKVCVVDREWRVSPDVTTAYQIVPDDTPLTVDHGVARGGTNRTITIRAYASSIDDVYLCNIVTIIAGKGRGQARLVGSYDGTTNIVTICGDDWVDIPDTTSVYVMMPYGVACAACVCDTALAAINAEVVDAIAVDTYAEPGQEKPPATASLAAKIGHMFKGYRNKSTSDSDSVDLYNDAGDTVDQKRVLSDNGTTFVKNEIVSGP